MEYKMLLSPMKIGSLELKNRTVMTAAEFSLGQPDGKPTEMLMDYYEERAKGCLLYPSPSPRDGLLSRMPSSA